MSETSRVACPRHGSRLASACSTCAARPVAICAALDGAELWDLEAIMSRRSVVPGQTIVLEGEPGDSAYNIADGAVKLYKSLADGRAQITGFLLPGDFLGLPSRGPHAYSAEAIAPTGLCRFSRPQLEAIFDKYPALEERFLSTVNDEITAAQEHMLLLGRKNAAERLATLLTDLASRYERLGRSIEPMMLPMQRVDIADYLGLTIETVSRTFSALKRKGLIALPRPDQVLLLRREALEDLASGA